MGDCRIACSGNTFPVIPQGFMVFHIPRTTCFEKSVFTIEACDCIVFPVLELVEQSNIILVGYILPAV